MNGLDATLALVWREWVRLLRQPARLVATVGTPLVLLVALGSGFAGSISGLMGVEDQRAYAAFLLPGMMAMSVLFASVFGAISLIEDRDGGILLVLMAGPAPSGSIVLAKVIGVGVPAFAQALLMLPAAWLLGLDPSWLDLMLAVLATLLLTLGVVGLSLALAWRSRSTQEFHAVMNTVLMPLWLLSGSFYPASEAAAPMRWITAVNPLAWGVETLRGSLSGQASALLGGLAWPLAGGLASFGVLLAVRTIGLRKRSRAT